MDGVGIRLLVAASSLALLTLLVEPVNLPSHIIYPKDCGKRPAIEAAVSETKIAGGHEARHGAWPWQVSVQTHSLHFGYQHVCSGVLINHNLVLTAAHCVPYSNDSQRYRVVVGLHFTQQADKYILTSNVSEIIVHVNFSKKNFQDDIALMLLVEKFKFGLYIQPICLPRADQPLIEKYPCYIAGWGQKVLMGPPPASLQEAQVQLISRHICNSEGWYAGMLQSNVFCAGFEEGGVGSCLGDNGGPLMCFYPNNARFYLLGITSFGCKRNAPTIYTWIPGYIQWIDSVLVSHVATPMSIPQALYFWIIGWVTLHLVL